MRNGISVAGLSELADEIRHCRSQGQAAYGVRLNWLSGTRMEAGTLPLILGDQTISRDFKWLIDEPRQMGGANHAASPQEYLLAGFGSCLMVAFLVGASVSGIRLSHLEIEVRSELDLAGFMELDESTFVALSGIRYVIRVAGEANRERFEAIREAAEAHSPNAMSLAQGVTVSGILEVI